MQATQAERPFRLRTSLGSDALLLDSFEATERISTPYRFVLRLLSPDPNIDMQALLAKPVVLTLRLTAESERHIHGHICRLRLLEFSRDGMAAYEAEVVPWLWFLNLFSDCRIFQNKTVPKILEQVFNDRGFKNYRIELRGTYPKRDYCVQYAETDFNFVSRLMEEEGIFYFFRQSADRHTLVLADAPAAFEPCPNKPRARFLATTGSRQDEDTIVTLDQECCVYPGTATVKDYDFEKPNTSLLATLAGGRPGEFYTWPGLHKTKDGGDRYARLRLEEQAARSLTARGTGNCIGFECGYKFELSEHYRDDANREYAIVGLEHSARNTGYRSGSQSPFEYSNRFDAIPASTPFRPPRIARKPRIEGTQTALVVGPKGEEIYADRYGRVIVQFHWDRQGRRNEGSSCPVRVAQNWAGKRWGAVFIPRVGQEVVVSFLDGDPDRPLITGSVYNADQEPPYELPGEQTKSAIKTMSSKGGGGFNEIRFEDLKDSEQVFLHAEKDLDVRVKNDRKEWVGRDGHRIAQRDRVEKAGRDSHAQTGRDDVRKIGRDCHIAIGGKAAIKVTGASSLTVEGNVGEDFKGSYTYQTAGSVYLKGAQIVIEAESGLTLKAGASFITLDEAGVAVQGPMIQLNSAGAALPGMPGMIEPPVSPAEPAEAADSQAGQTTAVAETDAATPAQMKLDSLAAE